VADLEVELERSRDRVERFQGTTRIGESNTKASLIEPVIAALGWDIHDPDEVCREYRRSGAENPVDYALLVMRTPRLFIEAKGLGENLADVRWAGQTLQYAAVAGVEWVALTDGDEWRVYNAHAAVPLEGKLFRTVRLTDDIGAAADLLTLLSKDNLLEKRIDVLWESNFIDRRLHGALMNLFTGEPSRGLVRLLGTEITLSPKDIRAGLHRVRARFDFPSAIGDPMEAQPLLPEPELTPLADSPADSLPRSAAGRRVGLPRVSAAERAIRLPDLVRVGSLVPGQKIYALYFGQECAAEVTADGRVLLDGTTYKSLSKAGEVAKTKIRSNEQLPTSVLATDGWFFWAVRDPDGSLTPLAEIRTRAAAPPAH
jgi:hypothetical protein